MSQVRFLAAVARLTRAPQEDFDAKVAFVKSWTYGGSKVTNDEKLTCYGLYKRVFDGEDVSFSQPPRRDP